MTYAESRGRVDAALAEADAEYGRVFDALGDAQMQVADRDAQLEELRAEYDAYKTAHPDTGPVDPPPPPPPPPTSRPLLGSSMSKNPHPGPLDYDRCYNAGQVDDAVRNHAAKRVALTFDDDPKDPADIVRRLKAIKAKYPTLLIDLATENEVERHRSGDIPRFVSELKATQAAVHTAFPNGDVLVGADFIVSGIKAGKTEPFLLEMKKQGVVLDFAAFSCYPEGRKHTPAVESPLSEHIDPCFALAAKYGIKRIACWEIGTPISSRYDRPTVVAKWAPHMVAQAQQYGQEFIGCIYWDSGDAPDNRWVNDAPKTQNAFLHSLDAA